MALFCPNINSPEYKKLLSAVDGNSNLAYYYWNKFEGNLPNDFYTNTQQVDTQEVVKDSTDYILKSIDILSTPKAKQVFDKGVKNNWSIDKILQELAIPKEQKQLLIDSYNELLDNELKKFEKICN